MKADNFYSVFSSVSRKKIDDLKLKIDRIGLSLNDIEESFVKGGGKGGQKINKTNNAVVLRYTPLGITVKCQKERSLGVNRFLALRELVDKIEKIILKEPDKKYIIGFEKRRGVMILEGKKLAENILNETKIMSDEFFKKTGRRPFLAIINYFENSPSTYYMNLKIKKCQSVGIDTKVYIPENKTDKEYFLSLIKTLNNDKNIDAIMVEKPLPEGFDDERFWNTIDSRKDVDALSSNNMGMLFITKKFSDIEEEKFFVPQTAYAAVKLMKYHDIDLNGKNVVVVGRSSIVGKPLSTMLSLLDATVTLCHSKTKNLNNHLKNADIIITAIGRAKYIKDDMIGENQIIIDIGTNFDENGKMCGDVDFELVKDKVKAITPVPGGVGPVTLSLLLRACVKAAKNLV